MPTPMSASEILDREFLELRAKILELAASFDRLDRAEGFLQDDPRLKLLHQGLDSLQEAGGDRAEQVQLLFSRPYDDDWQEKFQLPR
jgi:hypothetical protein